MRRPSFPHLVPLLSAAVLVSWAVASGQAALPASADGSERQKLAGVWKGFCVEGKGETPDRGPVKVELTVTAEVMKGIQIKGDERIDHGEGSYVLDLAADPRVLDATKANERGRKETWLGIYSLEGDTLKWCVGRKARPTTFETVKGQFLLILKRDKAQ